MLHRATSIAALLGASGCSFFLTDDPAACDAPAWAQVAGSEDDDSGRAVATDSECNVYTCGEYRRTLVLDVLETALANQGERDAYVAKLSGSGELVWRVGFGGTGDDGCVGLEVSDGRVFLTGYVSGDVSLDGGVELAAGAGTAAYVAALSADSGAPIWGVAFGEVGPDEPRQIAVGGDRVVAVGSAYGGMVGDQLSLETSPAPQGYAVAFTRDGEVAWGRTFASGHNSRLEDAVVTGEQVVVAGSVQTPGLIPDTDGCAAMTTGQNGSDNAVVAGLRASDGACQWMDALPSSGESRALAVAVDASGNILAAGGHRGNTDTWSGTLCDYAGCPQSVSTGFGGQAAFIGRWSASGVPDRAYQLGGASTDEIADIDIHPETGEIAALANFRCDANFGGDTLEANAEGDCQGGAADQPDIAVVRFSPDLEHLGSASFGSTDSETADAIRFVGDRVVIRGDLDNPFEAGGLQLAPSGGGDDMFTAVLGAP